MMQDTNDWCFMNKSDIKNSADMFLYKAIVDLNSGKHLLEAFNADEIETYIEKQSIGLYGDLDRILGS